MVTMSYQVYSPTPHAYVPYGNGSVSHNGAIPNAFQNGGLSPGGYGASHPGGGGGGFVFRKRHERVDWRKIGKDAHIRICRERYEMACVIGSRAQVSLGAIGDSILEL